jgi:competence protein ComEC
VPLVLGAAAALLGGLICGGSEHAVSACAVALAFALWGVWRRAAWTLPVALLMAAAAWHGTLAAASADACRMRAAQRGAWRGTLDLTSAAPGERVRATVQVAGPDGPCMVLATLVVAHGRAAAGAQVMVHGSPTATPRGVLVLAATVAPTGGHDWRLVARARAAAWLDRRLGPHAPMARALLVADTRDLDLALKDRFADSGLIHALSISGLHVAIVAQALTLLFGLARATPTVASLAGLAATAGYVLLLGAPPPAVRAAVMLAVPAVAKAMQRPVSPWATVAWGSALPLLDNPLAALDVGYQLSVGGMAALIAAGAWARRAVGDRLSGWRATVARELLTGAAVAVLTAPLSAWHVGRLSLVAPATNLVASPLLSLLQPALFVALAAAPVPVLGPVAADGTWPLLAAFDFIARVGAAVPGAAMSVTPGPFSAVATGFAVTGLGAACLYPDFARKGLAVACAALAALVWQPVVAPARFTELHVFDVGQGDALGLRTRTGRWILIDAGPAGRTSDAGRSVVLPSLRRLGGTVHTLVLTHPDLDHVGGAASLIRATRPAQVLEPAFPGTSNAYRDALVAAGDVGARWRAARAGDSVVVDDVVLTVLAPDSAMVANAPGPNDASVVVMARVGTVRLLLTGDAEAAEEAWLAQHWGDALRADVLKVGHHGSRTSTTAPLLSATRPAVALVSVGNRNRYGHPAPDVLASLARQGAAVLRTDRLGPLIVRTDGARVEAEAAGERWLVPRRRQAP